MIPGRPSDAGPEPRRREEDSFECSNCGTGGHTVHSTYRCQGAVPDLCQNRVGECCRQQCAFCGLDVCSEHAISRDGETICIECLTALAEQAELTPQEEAAWLAMMSAAGVTLDELRAAEKGRQ